MQYLDETGRVSKAIVIHKDWVSRGFVFVTSSGGETYILVNSGDFNVACAQLMMKDEPEDLCDYVFDVPIVDNEEMVMCAIGGQYLWTSVLS